MKREIIFRGKDGLTRKWIFSKQLGLADFFKAIEQGNLLTDTLGQFSGEHEMTGSAVYEDDILEYEGTNDVVKFKDGSFMCHGGGASDFREYKKIGNIHDNPELLKKD